MHPIWCHCCHLSVQYLEPTGHPLVEDRDHILHQEGDEGIMYSHREGYAGLPMGCLMGIHRVSSRVAA